MMYKFVAGLLIAVGLGKLSDHLPGLSSWHHLFIGFPDGVRGATLFMLRAGVGALFMLHGYPKITHLQQWSQAVKMPVSLCWLSALSMVLGGLGLIAGFLTPLDSVAILGSMLFAIFLDLKQGLPFVAVDPYQIPDGQYEGPQGKGEPPSWEKAFMYCLMLMAIAVLGPGAFSLDAWLWGS